MHPVENYFRLTNATILPRIPDKTSRSCQKWPPGMTTHISFKTPNDCIFAKFSNSITFLPHVGRQLKHFDLFESLFKHLWSYFSLIWPEFRSFSSSSNLRLAIFNYVNLSKFFNSNFGPKLPSWFTSGSHKGWKFREILFFILRVRTAKKLTIINRSEWAKVKRRNRRNCCPCFIGFVSRIRKEKFDKWAVSILTASKLTWRKFWIIVFSIKDSIGNDSSSQFTSSRTLTVLSITY